MRGEVVSMMCIAVLRVVEHCSLSSHLEADEVTLQCQDNANRIWDDPCDKRALTQYGAGLISEIIRYDGLQLFEIVFNRARIVRKCALAV